MKFHPYAEIFPLIEGEEFNALVDDIKAHGLREKIWLYDGKVLDGRNRFLACQKAKVKPAYRKFSGSDEEADAFVWSINAARRHLSASQLSMAAAKRATLRDGERKAGAQFCAPSQGEAAKDAGVSRRSVQQARKVIESGSKALQKAVENDEVSVSKAASVVNLPKSEQLAAATKKPEPQPIEDERWEPEDDEDDRLMAIEREQEVSLQKWLDADDKLAAAHAEVKRLAAEVAVLKISRDGFQNRCGEQARIIKSLRNKLEKLEKKAA